MSFYNYVVTRRNDSAELRSTVESTVTNLLANATDVERPGMLLGKIQSGKTRAFVGVIALGFDRGYDIAIVLTKNSRALVEQTTKRLNSEFTDPIRANRLYVYDIMHMPGELSGFIRGKKLIFVVKKEADNLRHLSDLFDQYQDLASKNVLIVDDEADYASVTYYPDGDVQDGVRFGRLAHQISDFRRKLNSRSDFLQVTATPYSLFLQPEDISINSVGYAPLRPTFTVLLQPHQAYIGGEYYFEDSLDQVSPASDLFVETDPDEFERLRRPNQRYVDTILRTNNLYRFRFAILTYLCGGAIRIIQERQAELAQEWAPPYRSAFMMHVDQRRGGHAWQGDLVGAMLQRLLQFFNEEPDNFRELFAEPYQNLEHSLRKTEFEVPTFDAVYDRVIQALRDDEISVREINSENQVIDLLDENGQLRLDNPFNIFIGGQVLDRGITVDNLIGFFYGRNPGRFQMDTVLQHSRMYGSRSRKDLAITRFYTSPRIYAAMQSMHFCDEALREAIQRQGDQSRVRFLERGGDGSVIPCGPAKIRISNLKTIRSRAMEKPVGIQTRARSYIASTISTLDTRLTISNRTNQEPPDLMTVDEACEIIDSINSTFEFSNREHYKNEEWEWDVEGFKESLRYASNFARDNELREHVYVLIRAGRNQSRMKDNELAFNDAPYDGRTDVPLARQYATQIPVLMLLRQEGNEAQGWIGHPFYWPVLVYPDTVPLSIYSEA